MSFRQMLLGSTVTRAPENDEGLEFDDEVGSELDQDQEADDELDEDGLDPDEDEDQGDPDEDDPPARQPSRSANRVATLAAERKAEKERADNLQAELNRLRQGGGQPQETPQQAAARREAHLATLTEAGRLEFMINENKAQTQSALNEIRFASFDATDKAAFDGLCARNPSVAALKTEVETTLAAMRASGTNAPRETVVAYVIGQRALNKQGRAKTSAGKRAAEGKDRQTARAPNGRGDVAPGSQRRTGDREARRKRLEGMQI